MSTAFFSNMPRVLVHLLPLILAAPFILQAQNLAEADYKLIQAACHNSETPTTCMRCVISTPGSEKVNSIGIATIVVNCINNQAETLAANMTSLASKTSDQKLKPIYQGCAQGFSTAKNELASAKQDLQEHKYDNAEESVVNALKLEYQCHVDITSYQSEVSSGVVFDMRIYEELSEAACRIIEKL